MKGIDTKYGQRAMTCSDSIQAAVETQRDVLAPLKPMAQATIQLLKQELSQEVIEEMDYHFGRIEEFIAKWRPSPTQNPSILYIQPNWAESIDNDVQSARKAVADLARDFSEGKFVLETEMSPLNRSAAIVKGKAFVAMAIDPADASLEDVLDAVKATCTECNIHAQRIDDDQSNERITDRIVASIRTAEFVIVDLTLPRPNVFFEAGFAHGLDKTPIYIARHGTRLEFDIKDYPAIFFRSMRDLKTGLAERLNALLAQHVRDE